MAEHGKGADHKGKGKELATTSSPSTSTYNVHFVRLALQKVGGCSMTDFTRRDTFYRTLALMHDRKGRQFKIPIYQEGHLDLHRLLLEVISRGGIRKVEKEGLLEEVRDIISPSISVCYLLDLYYWFLLDYCEDFITANTEGGCPELQSFHFSASQPISTERPQLAQLVSNPVTYDEEFYPNSSSTDPPMRLPDGSSSLWGMVDELLTRDQTTVSQQRERNIRSAIPPSSNHFAQSISSARPVQRALKFSLLQPIPLHQNSAGIASCVELLVEIFLQADITGNQSASVVITLPEAQIAPISQEINSLPIEDLANAQKKLKTSMEDPTHQPNTQMIAEQVGNLREAGKAVENQKAMTDQESYRTELETQIPKANSDSHGNMALDEKAEGSSGKHDSESEKNEDKDLNMELSTGTRQGSSPEKCDSEGEKTVNEDLDTELS